MFAKLTALVSGSTALPYDLDDVAGEQTTGGWTHLRATSKADKSRVSLFKFSFSPSDDPRRTEAAKHGVKSLRTLRHPNVLVFKDSLEIEEKNVTNLYLITEPVQLLSNVLQSGQLSGHQRNAFLSMGLRQVACALSFLNVDCQQVHGNVCLGTIVVAENLDWKLSCLDTLSEHATLATSIFRENAAFLNDVYKCPELGKQDWEGLAAGPPWGVDSWGMGCLICEVFANQSLSSPSRLRETSAIPEDLLKDYQRLLSSAAAKRLSPQKLMKNKFLNSPLVEVVSFLESLAVKESTEKSTFFKRLTQMLVDLPELVIHQKILPMVIDALEFGSASPNALSCIMKIAQGMEEEQFQTSIAPALTRFFSSSDRTIRRVLLENIEKFGERLPAALIDGTIYPALTNGFSDSNAYLRELTLKSMQHFAPKLSQKTLNQSLLKFLAKLQVDPEPSIRANTTVLLGFIADHLGEASCKRILLNAFNRALKDQFPPTRIAGLKSLVATKKYYAPPEVAQKVIPSVSPLSVDGVQEVRDQALSCLEIFVKALKEAAVSENADGDQPVTSEAKTSTTGQNYVSWAVSSLGFLKTTETETKPEVKPVGVDYTSHTSSPVKTSEKSLPMFHDASSRPASSGSDSAEAEDRWDFDDEDFEEEAKATKPPAKRTTPPASGSRSNKEEPDLWGELGMKATLPKESTAAVRRKAKGRSKPMKLGAKKLT